MNSIIAEDLIKAKAVICLSNANNRHQAALEHWQDKWTLLHAACTLRLLFEWICKRASLTQTAMWPFLVYPLLKKSRDLTIQSTPRTGVHIYNFLIKWIHGNCIGWGHRCSGKSVAYHVPTLSWPELFAKFAQIWWEHISHVGWDIGWQAVRQRFNLSKNSNRFHFA